MQPHRALGTRVHGWTCGHGRSIRSGPQLPRERQRVGFLDEQSEDGLLRERGLRRSCPSHQANRSAGSHRMTTCVRVGRREQPGRFLLLAAAAASSLASGAGAGPSCGCAADDLRRLVADRSVHRVRSGARYSFAGSNALETQIRNGAPADVFASAAPLNTQRLFRAKLVGKPVSYTANRLVLIVPKSNPAGIRTVYDLGGSR